MKNFRVFLIIPFVIYGSQATASPVSDAEKEVQSLRFADSGGIKLANALTRLGLAQAKLEELVKAERALAESLALCRVTPGKENANLIVALIYLADLKRHRGDYTGATTLADEAVNLARKADRQEDIAICLDKLALIDIACGRYTQGEEHARESVSLLEKSSGQSALAVAVAKLALADNIRLQKRYEEALPILLACNAVLDCQPGYEQPTCTARNNLGALYFWLGDYKNARKYLELAYSLRQRYLPPVSEELANSLSDLACLEQVEGRLEKAHEELLQALAIRDRTLGRRHRETGIILGNLASVCAAQGLAARAREYYLEALDIYKSLNLSNHPETAMYQAGLQSLEAK